MYHKIIAASFRNTSRLKNNILSCIDILVHFKNIYKKNNLVEFETGKCKICFDARYFGNY